MEIEGGLRRRLEEIYGSTRIKIKTKAGITSGFEVKKGIRQGCTLSALLFNLYIAEVDTYMKKKGVGGIALGKERIWSLAYADDMILLAKNSEALLEMMTTFRKFCKDRELLLNVDKTKILVFNRKRNETKEK